jgi:flagellar M-ring protein FliF
VRVINAPFRAEPPPKADDTPLHRQPWLLDLLRAAAAPLALVLVALLVLFKLVRPALTALIAASPRPAGRALDVVADNDVAPALPGQAAAAPLPLGGPPPEQKLAQARAFAKEHPAAVAQIVKGWVGGEAS